MKKYLMIFILMSILLSSFFLVDQLAQSKGTGRAMITFSYDDGFRSFYTKAYPLHQKYQIPSSVYVIADRLIDSNQWNLYMNPQQVSALDQDLVEIGSHTFSHPDLRKLTAEEVKSELEKSKQILSQYAEIDTFAVPYAYYSDSIEEQAKKVYKGVRNYGGILNAIPVSDPFNLHSIAIYNTTNTEMIKKRINQAVRQKKWLILMIHDLSEEAKGRWQTTPAFIEEILQYVTSYSKDELVPVTVRDGLEKQKEQDK